MNDFFINRTIESRIRKEIEANKVTMIIGARRVGKSILLKVLMQDILKNEIIFLNGEDVNDQQLLQERSVSNYTRLLINKKYLIIDEAQKIEDIGLKLKLIVDNIPDIFVIVTGSSIFDLGLKMGEPLVGRKKTYQLFPIAQMELNKYEDLKTISENLPLRLIYGAYPELVQIPDLKKKENYLYELVNDYLLKDILEFDGIRNSKKIYSLLKLIAFQIGKEVSIPELSNSIDLSKATVEKYLNMISKVFVLLEVKSFSKNHRKEISKMSKWYFLDNGIRNALIRNFNLLNFRNDTGELWENYLVSERIKFLNYNNNNTSFYFWRTYDHQEIDWIEEYNSNLAAYEFKWNPLKKVKCPGGWQANYSSAEFNLITQNNYLDFIT
ncbi:MAG: ATP-binding protein [Saprospiraceae bacterium]|nr:ATP-binding protein [Saprospiraceae bacterium]